MEQLFELVVELIGLALADVLEPGPVMLERPRRQLGDERIVEPVQFEFEEQKIGRGGGDFFLRVAIKFHPRRIGRIAGIDEPGIGHDAPQKLFQRLVALDRLEQPRAGGFFGERFELALIGGMEAFAVGLGLGEIVREGAQFHGGIKVFEVPFRQMRRAAGAGLGFALVFGLARKRLRDLAVVLRGMDLSYVGIAVIASKAPAINLA